MAKGDRKWLKRIEDGQMIQSVQSWKSGVPGNQAQGQARPIEASVSSRDHSKVVTCVTYSQSRLQEERARYKQEPCMQHDL